MKYIKNIINFNDWDEIDNDNESILDYFFSDDEMVTKSILELNINNYEILLKYMKNHNIKITWNSRGDFNAKLKTYIILYETIYLRYSLDRFFYYRKNNSKIKISKILNIK